MITLLAVAIGVVAAFVAPLVVIALAALVIVLFARIF